MQPFGRKPEETTARHADRRVGVQVPEKYVLLRCGRHDDSVPNPPRSERKQGPESERVMPLRIFYLAKTVLDGLQLGNSLRDRGVGAEERGNPIACTLEGIRNE